MLPSSAGLSVSESSMMHSVAAAAGVAGTGVAGTGVAGAGVAGTVDGEGFLVKKEVILNVPSALSFTSFFSFFSFFGTPSLGPRRTPLSDKGQDETLSRLPFAV